MIATDQLRGIIAARGLSQRKVAQRLGMNEKTFYTKMKLGKFGTDEAEKMVQLLGIESPADIFFAKQ